MIEIKQQLEQTLYIQCIDTLNICQGNKVIHIEYKNLPHLISRLIELGGAVRDSNDAWNDWFDGDRKDVFTDWLNKHYHLIPKADKK